MMKTHRLKIDGILLLDKPLHWSSNEALQKVKWLFHARKAGHTGSLDPLATGLLPICFGEATKFSQYLLDADKRYTVKGRLGFFSSTGDAEGELHPEPVSPELKTEGEMLLRNAIKAFEGVIEQVPPMYSALKHKGVALYTLARQGETVERKPRQITIYSIALKQYYVQDGHYDFELTVHCSKGTYIRTLVEDIGKALNTGAYVTELRRDSVGPYSVEKAYPFETLAKLAEIDSNSLSSLLLLVETSLSGYPVIHLNNEQAKAITQGKKIQLTENETVNISNDPVLTRLIAPQQRFLGLGELEPGGTLRVKRLVERAM